MSLIPISSSLLEKRLNVHEKDLYDWSALHRAVEKRDIIEHYGESLMQMQMHMFYKKMLGRSSMGQNCKGKLQMQKREESGELGGHSSIMDLGNAAKSFRSLGA